MSAANQLSEKQVFAIRTILFMLEEALAVDSVQYSIGFFAKGPAWVNVEIREDHVLHFRIMADGFVKERKVVKFLSPGFVLPTE